MSLDPVLENTAPSDQAQYAAAAQQLIEQDQPMSSIALAPLGQTLLGEFNQAVNDRLLTEQRWLQDLRQYRGQYDPEVEARIKPNKSKAFVRKTRVKVKTVDARVLDLLFPAGKDKNWSIAPTPKPKLSPDQLTEIQKALQALMQAEAQQAQQAGMPPPPAKPTRDQFDQAVLTWAKQRCARMSLTIDDQLAETSYKAVCKKAIHSGNLYGTGVVKGPLVERRVRTRFVVVDGKWEPQTESYVVPFIDYVPLWRLYPDMSVTELKDSRYTWERHLMSKAEMVELTTRPSFQMAKAEIVDWLKSNPKGYVVQRYSDSELRIIGDRQYGMGDTAGKYEVLERWGYLDGTQLLDAGIEVGPDRLHESFFANVWIMPNGQVIKCVLQPINGVTWPYHFYYFDKDESSIFGEGIATIMRDDQTNVNASTRLMLDNAAITSGPQIEVNPMLLANVDKVYEMNPWKVWLRNAQSPEATAIKSINFESRITELGQMVSMFGANADETTAIPRYVSGENATSGAAATASGLSMQMGNVNIVIKDLITNWDEGVTCSFIQGMYFWNMQFNPDNTIKGDFDVSAGGVASLVAKEVRSQMLLAFAQSAATPHEAQYVKWDVLLRQRAEVIEATDVVMTEEEVKAQENSAAAQQEQQMQMQMQQAQLAEAQAKAQKLAADVQLITQKAQEVVGKIALIAAQTVQAKVETAYAALQAGGTATQSPYIAPAGDEILREAGWQSAIAPSEIANLNSQPVQQTDATNVILPKGSTFGVEPRAGQPAQPGAQPPAPPTTPPAAPPVNVQRPGAQPGAALTGRMLSQLSPTGNDSRIALNPTGNDSRVDQPAAKAALTPPVAKVPNPTGMKGREHGIETERIEKAP